MLHFFDKKTPEKSSPTENLVDYNACPEIYFLKNGLAKYELTMDEPKHNAQEVLDLANEIMQLMIRRGVTYQTAMQLPYVLHNKLKDFFLWRVCRTLLDPLPDDGHDQSDDGNRKGED